MRTLLIFPVWFLNWIFLFFLCPPESNCDSVPSDEEIVEVRNRFPRWLGWEKMLWGVQMCGLSLVGSEGRLTRSVILCGVVCEDTSFASKKSCNVKRQYLWANFNILWYFLWNWRLEAPVKCTLVKLIILACQCTSDSFIKKSAHPNRSLFC